MSGNSNFVLDTVEGIKPVLVSKGFKAVTLNDVLEIAQLPRSTFFEYFGSVGQLYELVLYSELSACYQAIYTKIEGILDFDVLLEKAKKYRTQFIVESKVLSLYFQSYSKLPMRFGKLKRTVLEMEREMFLFVFSEWWKPEHNKNKESIVQRVIQY